MNGDRYIHPAETGLFVAASLRGYTLFDMPGGHYGVYRSNNEQVEPVAKKL